VDVIDSLNKLLLFFMKLFLFLVHAICYRLCNKDNYPFSGQSVVIPLIPSAAQTIVVNGVSVPVSVQGQIRIIDGCSFEVINFTLLGSYSGVWFGGNGTESDGYRLSTAPVISSQGSLNTTYQFITDAGSWVSYYDFTQFRLFEVNSLTLLATADLPPKTTGSNSPKSGSSSITFPFGFYFSWILILLQSQIL
jgi:hypothetical protein